MKIYYNPKCSKCRESLCLLEEQGIEPEIIKYLDQPPSKDELKDVIRLLGIKPLELIRKGEDIFKKDYKNCVLSDDQWIEVMILHPHLIERPIVIDGDKAVIGRPPIKILEIFNNA
jgi:arsenate reductase